DVGLVAETGHRLWLDPPHEADAVHAEARRKPAQAGLLAPVAGNRQRRLRIAALEDRERSQRRIDAVTGLEIAGGQEPGPQRGSIAVAEARHVHEVPDDPRAVPVALEDSAQVVGRDDDLVDEAQPRMDE